MSLLRVSVTQLTKARIDRSDLAVIVAMLAQDNAGLAISGVRQRSQNRLALSGIVFPKIDFAGNSANHGKIETVNQGLPRERLPRIEGEASTGRVGRSEVMRPRTGRSRKSK
jgi:hypothetical protein